MKAPGALPSKHKLGSKKTPARELQYHRSARWGKKPDSVHKGRNTVAQSICTHYSCFENMGRFVTLKKNQVKNMGCKKQGAKNRVIIIQKEKRAAASSLFE